MQYLTDLLAVHTALEQALLAVAPTAADASAAAPEAGSSSSGPKGSATETTEAGAGGLTLVGALRQLAADTRGLQRTLAIRHDMVRLVTTSQTDGSENTAGSNGSSSGSANATAGAAAAAGTAAEQLSAAIPRVGTMAKTYAAYVSKISSELSAALAAGGGGSPSAAAEAAAAKLLAHAYSLHVTHLTTGQRIGATAAERLGLFGRGATSTYMEYPPEVADPMRSFVQAVNAAGSQLRSAADRGAVFDELPEAMKNTALLLQALAHAN